MNLAIFPSTETYLTQHMTAKENPHIGEIIRLGYKTLQITGVYYSENYKYVDISVYEAWGKPGSHAPMTTCGHNLTLRKREGGQWYFSGDEYLNDCIAGDSPDILDGIVGDGALVVKDSMSARWVPSPRRLARKA